MLQYRLLNWAATAEFQSMAIDSLVPEHFRLLSPRFAVHFRIESESMPPVAVAFAARFWHTTAVAGASRGRHRTRV
jgi:hypothetical protein